MGAPKPTFLGRFDRLINPVFAIPGTLPLLSFTLHERYIECLQCANKVRRDPLRDRRLK